MSRKAPDLSQLSQMAPRTLIISPNWIGDAVMAQPLLYLLKQEHPDRAIDVLCPPSTAAVWRAMQEVDDVMENSFRHGALQLGERWTLSRTLRQRGYADAYVLPNALKYALIPWMAGIRRRVGYKGESRYGLLNVMHHDQEEKPRPMIAFYAALAKAPSAVATPVAALPRPRLHVSESEIKRAMGFAALHMEWPVVIFAPGAEFGSAKRWPARHFAQLANLVWQSMPYAQIILLGSNKDNAICEKIVSLERRVRNLAGLTRLTEAIALIARAHVVVANDSGLLHIASALNRPLLALYGPTDPEHAPPFSDVAKSLSLKLPCAPCKQRSCPLGHRDCMRKMDSEMVYQELKPMLKSDDSTE